MAKTITIGDEVYEKLQSVKKGRVSATSLMNSRVVQAPLELYGNLGVALIFKNKGKTTRLFTGGYLQDFDFFPRLRVC